MVIVPGRSIDTSGDLVAIRPGVEQRRNRPSLSSSAHGKGFGPHEAHRRAPTSRLKRNSRRLVGIVTGIVVLLAGTVAFAAWTSNGTGTGTATARSAQALTINVSPATGLFPTGTVNVPFTVTNPNPYAVTLSKIALTNVTVDKPGCTAAVVSGADLPDTDVIAAGATTVSRNFSVTMSNAAEDACQGAVFTLTLQANGASS